MISLNFINPCVQSQDSIFQGESNAASRYGTRVPSEVIRRPGNLSLFDEQSFQRFNTDDLLQPVLRSGMTFTTRSLISFTSG